MLFVLFNFLALLLGLFGFWIYNGLAIFALCVNADFGSFWFLLFGLNATC
jgi:hypothetical protein